jgi:hypothetical protein
VEAMSDRAPIILRLRSAKRDEISPALPDRSSTKECPHNASRPRRRSDPELTYEAQRAGIFARLTQNEGSKSSTPSIGSHAGSARRKHTGGRTDRRATRMRRGGGSRRTTGSIEPRPVNHEAQGTHTWPGGRPDESGASRPRRPREREARSRRQRQLIGCRDTPVSTLHPR